MLNVAKTGLRKETMVELTFHYASLLKETSHKCDPFFQTI